MLVRKENKIIRLEGNDRARDFHNALLGLGELINILADIRRKYRGVPNNVHYTFELADTLSDGLYFVLRSNGKNLDRTVNDPRLKDMRSTYSKFVRAAEDVKKEMENPRSENWAHDISLRSFNEDLSYIYALNNIL